MLPHGREACQLFFSQSDLDDGPPIDLLEPFLQPGLVLLPKEDLSDLLFGLGKGFAGQALLPIEPENMVAELTPERAGGVPRRLVGPTCTSG